MQQTPPHTVSAGGCSLGMHRQQLTPLRTPARLPLRHAPQARHGTTSTRDTVQGPSRQPRSQSRPHQLCRRLDCSSGSHQTPRSRRVYTICSAAAVQAEPAPVVTPRGLLGRWKKWWSLGTSVEDEKLPSAENFRHTVGRLWNLIKGETWLILAASFCMTVAALSELAIPHFVSASIFAVTKASSSSAFYANVKMLAICSSSYGLFAGMRGFLFSILNITLIRRLRGGVFGALVRQPVAFFDNEEVGALTSRLGSDCQAVVRCLSTSINVAIRNSMQCIAGAVYLAHLSKNLFWTCTGVTALLWLVALRYGSFSRQVQRVYQDDLAQTTQVAEEVFSLSRVVRTFGTEAMETSRYDRWLLRLRYLGVRQSVAYLIYLTCNSSLYYLAKVATLLVGGAMALQGVITAEQLTTFVLYVEFVTAASLGVCDQWGPICEALGASERVIGYIDRPPAPQIMPGTHLDRFTGRVEFKDVIFSYPTRPDTVALSGVNLTLEPGRLTALVGLSGSGKSSLVCLLQRLYDPTAGQVLIDGVDLNTMDSAWYRRQIGVVSQDPHLFGTDILSNIAYGIRSEVTQEQVEEAAKLANAHDFIMALPQGYHTHVTDKLLSGGQRQRIAIARALVRQPKLLILDEATSALDAESEAAVQGALDAAMQATGRTVLVIAHRLVTVRNADTIVVMHQGKVAEQGNHTQLLAHNGIYASLVQRQSGGLSGDDEDMAPHVEPYPAPTTSRSVADSLAESNVSFDEALMGKKAWLADASITEDVRPQQHSSTAEPPVDRSLQEEGLTGEEQGESEKRTVQLRL